VTTPSWPDAAEIFVQALELPLTERESYVQSACGSNTVLRDRVWAMLRADAAASPLLDATPSQLAEGIAVRHDADSNLVGQEIGPYTVLRVIGRGGMGIVCLAERADVEKQVALKLVAGGLASPNRIGRFLLERRVLARLEHPYIARLLDAGVSPDGTPWFALEYVAGQAIDQYCRAHALAISERLTLFLKVCEAVAYAHRNLVVHRDLKPSNIQVGDDGVPRLLDFGIAKLLGTAADDAPLTAGGALFTPQYASPEQLRGEGVTTASDVYQLGAVLYELLTGQRPQRPGAAATTKAGHGHLDVAVPSTRLDRDLANIVGMAMRDEPDQRYASAGQFADDVRRHLDGLPVMARPASVAYRVGKFVRRHRWGSAAGAVGLVGVVGFALVTGEQARRVEAQRVRAEQLNALMVDLFAGSDPTVSRGEAFTVRAVLDKGAARIKNARSIDPVVRGRLLSTVATTYHSLGLLRDAVDFQREALTALTSVLPPTDHDVLAATWTLGSFLTEAGQLASATALLEEGLETARRLRRGRRFERAPMLNALGYAKQVAGDHVAAQALYEEALTLYHDFPDSLGAAREATLVNLAFLAEARGDVAAAERYLGETLNLRLRRLEPGHAIVARSKVHLAGLLARVNQQDRAGQLVREALQVQRRLYAGDAHQDLAEALAVSATVLERQGKTVEAEQARREALATFTRVFGAPHVAVARATAELAGLLQRSGQLEEAAALYTEATRDYRALLGIAHPSAAITLANQAYTEFRRRRLAESEALYREALPVLDSAWAGTPQIATTLVDFATVLSARDKCEESEPLLRRALALERARRAGNHVDVIRPERVLGACLVRLRRYAEAESLLVGAHQKLVAGWGAASPFTIDAARQLVELYERWGKRGEADRYRTRRE
jgi:serine/threonine-protein kinase